MADVSKSYTFVDGQPARPAQINQNFDEIIAQLNDLEIANIKAAILNAANGLVKLNASADVPVAQINLNTYNILYRDLINWANDGAAIMVMKTDHGSWIEKNCYYVHLKGVETTVTIYYRLHCANASDTVEARTTIGAQVSSGVSHTGDTTATWKNETLNIAAESGATEIKIELKGTGGNNTIRCYAHCIWVAS